MREYLRAVMSSGEGMRSCDLPIRIAAVRMCYIGRKKSVEDKKHDQNLWNAYMSLLRLHL